MRRYQTSDNHFEVCRLNFTPLDKIIGPMFDQNNPAKGRSQENDKPGQKAKDGGEHETNDQQSLENESGN
jgi:hypothetical protein